MYCIVLVTVPNQEEAEKIAQGLLSEHLAACVNIMPKILSFYRWQGKVEQNSELLLIIKSRKDLFNKLAAKVKSLHSYSVPEIIGLPIIEGNKEYLDWISKETRDIRQET